jgi:predicted RNA-binding Zn ribbon-like protein
MSEHPDHTFKTASIKTPICLDFANTVGSRAGDNPVEYLTNYETLIDWGRKANLLTPADADRLRQETARYPARGAAALRRAIELREAIYGLFLAVANDGPPDISDLDVLNAALTEAQVKRRIVYYAARGFDWEWLPDVDAFDMLIGLVALSAAELLNSDQLGRVKRCAADTCGWLFMDTSRNSSRRWCDMGDCGNRAKARRFYQRRRASKAKH